LLVIQGDSDANVVFEETAGIVRALRRQGLEAAGKLETLVVPDERHGFRRWVNQLLAANKTMDFLVRRLKTDDGPVKSQYTIHADTVTNHAVNRRWMGCHSDPGFVQTPRGFMSNLISASSFGFPDPDLCSRGGHMDHHGNCTSVPSWTKWVGRHATGVSIGLAPAVVFATNPSMKVEATNGTVGVANRGLGSAGLFLEAGRGYEFEAWVLQDTNVTLFAELRDFQRNVTLSHVEFQPNVTGPAWGANWGRVNFTLTPSSASSCHAIEYGSDPAVDCGLNPGGDAHPCLVCSGELVLGLVDGGRINIGYAALQPGPWGRVITADGTALPVLRRSGGTLTQMGISVVRNGGSVTQAIRWKDWRGSLWNRPSNTQAWGATLLAGWGMFDQVDLAVALDIEPIISLAYDLNDPGDCADLVEYCWGSNATSWGKRRISDGHAHVYNVTTFELGARRCSLPIVHSYEIDNFVKTGSGQTKEN